MFAANHLGNRAGVHPAQNIQSLAALARQDATQHRGGFVFTQRALEHFFHVIGGAQAQAGLLFDGGDKFVQNGIDRLLRQVGHRHHGATQRLNFFGVQKSDDLSGLLLTEQQHQDSGTFGAGHLTEFFLQSLCRFNFFSGELLDLFFFGHFVVLLSLSRP